jgi:hypothetical protein
MPWVKIPPERLQHVGLFGYEFIQDGADGWAWYEGPIGKTAIDRADPNIWLEDIGEAAQLGARGISISPDDD